MKGLIIDEPWISYIIDGRKDLGDAVAQRRHPRGELR
jgi:hypothetical protein